VTVRLELHTRAGETVDLMPAFLRAMKAIASGTDFGQPADRETVDLYSQLAAGAVVAVSQIGNRALPIALLTQAKTTAGLTALEEILAPAVEDDADFLLYQPEDRMAPPTVWTVMDGVLEHQYDDLAEALRCERGWLATFTVLPWARSVDPVTFELPQGDDPWTRVQTALVDAQGSKPSPARITMAGALEAGQVFLYTAGNVPSPDMSQYVNAASPTSDETWLNGSYHALAADNTWSIPLAAIPPGTYHAYAELACSAGALTNAPVTLTVGPIGDPYPSPLADLYAAHSVTDTVSIGAERALEMVGAIELPGITGELDFGTLAVQFILAITGAGINVGALWLFNVSTGRLSIIDLPASADGVEVDAPYTDATRSGSASCWVIPAGIAGRVRIPSSAVTSKAVHMLAPGPNRVFVASTQSRRPVGALLTTGTHYPAWHTYAAAVAPTAIVTPDPGSGD
jgi:hypothetical protein